MRGILLAAGLLLATAAVQAQPTQLAATSPRVHDQVATSLLYRPMAEERLAPLAPRAVMPAVCKLPAYPTSLAYSGGKRLHRPHIEYIELTYYVTEDSILEPPARAVPGKPPKGRKK